MNSQGATSRAALFACVMLVLALQACDTRSRRASARLRTENAALEHTVAAQEDRIAELQAALAVAESARPMSEQVLAMTPLPVRLDVSSMSGFEPGDTDDTLLAEVHVEALDGRGRPVQLVGTLEVQILQAVEGGEPLLLGRVQLDPAQVRDAWRRSLTGATYLGRIEVDESAIEPGKTVLVHVFHDDARTGRRLETSGALNRPSTGQISGPTSGQHVP